MLSFKQYILREGGNLTYTDEHGKTEGADSVHTHERYEYMGHVHGVRQAISSHIGGHPVTPVGSAEHFLNPTIKTEQLEKAGKKKFGDMDFVVPDHEDVLHSVHGLKDHVGKMETSTHRLVHVKGSDDPNDPGGVFTLWKHKQTGKVIQVDVSPIKHNKNKQGNLEPDEGALWYKKSPKEDMFPEGNHPSVGGMASKIGLRAAAQAMRKPVAIKTKKGYKEGESGVTVSIGGRVPPGGRHMTRDTGERHPETGAPVHEELPSKGAERELHPHRIGSMIFGSKFNPRRTDTSHFHGVVAAIKAHGTPEQQDRFVHGMTDLLYGQGSQVASRHDAPGGREYDHAKKDPIISVLRNHFPNHPGLAEDHIAGMKKEYDARAATKVRK